MSQEEIRERAEGLDGAENIGKDGNVFVRGNLPLVFVAHMDTVYDNTPKPEDIIEENGIIRTKQGCGAGIGGDDRCGCWALFQMAEWSEESRPSLLFCSDEETCAGSSVGLDEYDWSFAKAIIEIDAPNFGCYYTDKHSNSALDDFLSDTIGLLEMSTSYNDIHEICKAGNPPGVTIGAGYYNQHNENCEWISVAGINAALETARMICMNVDKLEWSVVPKPKTVNASILGTSYKTDYFNDSSLDASFSEDSFGCECSPMNGTCYGCDDIDTCKKYAMWRDMLYGDDCLTESFDV